MELGEALGIFSTVPSSLSSAGLLSRCFQNNISFSPSTLLHRGITKFSLFCSLETQSLPDPRCPGFSAIWLCHENLASLGGRGSSGDSGPAGAGGNWASSCANLHLSLVKPQRVVPPPGRRHRVPRGPALGAELSFIR